MNRIDQRLAELKAEGRKALVTYIVVGDPSPEVTLPTMHEMVSNGADILELGVPFSDPMAEGPVIQLGHERALAHGTSLSDTLKLVAEFRKTNQSTPVVLMGYANPIERMGYQQITERCVTAGVDGLLTVDLPPEEASDLTDLMRPAGLNNIFLLAPTTTDARVDSVVSLAAGFLYYVSLKGVTGAGHLDTVSVAENVARIRAKTDLPICVGFGIKDGESAQKVAEHADGVVVGSVLVAKMAELAGQPAEVIASAVGALIRPIRTALDNSNH